MPNMICEDGKICTSNRICTMEGCQRKARREVIPTDPVIEEVRADLLRRQQLGYVKYGGTLATNPASLRDKLQHAYEEALDLCNYLKWSIMELDGSAELKPDLTHRTGHE